MLELAFVREADRIRSAPLAPVGTEPVGLLEAAIDRAREGDANAMRYLYVRYERSVLARARAVLRDDHDAEDVSQHVWARMQQSLRHYEQRKVPFAAWLNRIAHNAAVDQLRTRRAIPCEDVRATDRPDADLGREKSRELRQALEVLPRDQREVVVLRHVVGLSPGEIAERIGRSPDAVHGLHHRGRRALRAELTRRGCTPLARAAA